jgi:tRNA threonylcarbamoyladenosine biosynthesis protein TsaB
MKIKGELQLNTLIIDASTGNEFISIGNGKENFYCNDNIKLSHSVTLFKNIELLLGRSELDISQINLLGVGIGPGSFTGVRIAVTTMRMLAQILKIPLVGLYSQDMVASSIKTDGNIIVAADAKKGRVFGAVYSKIDDDVFPKTIIYPGDYYISQLLDNINENRYTVAIGNGSEKYLVEIKKHIHVSKFTFIKEYEFSGEKINELLIKKYNEKKEYYDLYSNTLPFYARKSDAEIAKEKKLSISP